MVLPISRVFVSSCVKSPFRFASVSLRVIISAHMKPGKRESYIRREVRELEKAFKAEREETAQNVMTSAALEKLNPRDRPKTRPLRTPKPLCHCSCPAMAEMYRTLLFYFLEAYGRASALYRKGNHTVVFPSGSYKPPLIVMNT